MDPIEENNHSAQDIAPPVEKLLTGLWRQREELGLIADELLDIFRRKGFAPPVDKEEGG